MRAYIDETYTEDGDGVPSEFMREVELSDYEPGCIEAIHHDEPIALSQLLDGASYSDQWLPKLDGSRIADSAICVFPPNQVGRTRASLLEYVGGFEHEVVFDERFLRIARGELD